MSVKVLKIFVRLSGVPIAICGFENDEGKFEVEDYCFIDPDPPSPLPEIDEDKFDFCLIFNNFLRPKKFF